MVPHPPDNATGRVRGWDFAASEAPSEGGTNHNPDYTVGVKMSRTALGRYCVEDVIRFRKRTDEVLRRVVEAAYADGLDECQQVIQRDPGAGGKIADMFFVRTLAEQGVAVRSVPTSGHQSKLSGFLPLCAIAESGNLDVVEAPWNEEFFAELENFIANNRNQKDD